MGSPGLLKISHPSFSRFASRFPTTLSPSLSLSLSLSLFLGALIMPVRRDGWHGIFGTRRVLGGSPLSLKGQPPLTHSRELLPIFVSL